MIGKSVSHYTILEKLGEGGMGVVYKAHDSKLDRDVALKFLSYSLASSECDQARFLQEARAAALLNHPNICTIHDVLEIDEGPLHGKQSIIVMEYVDGKSLREMLPVSSSKQATELGVQIASGLAAAHEKGLIHRDIKPENIMVHKGGRAVIMDFGLAKLKGGLSLTKTGATVGTAKYMSPEQVSGQDVDYRSDIFSLGVVLYELFTGHSPFKGQHEAAVLYEITNADPPMPSSYIPEIPRELETLILDCLAKDVNERCQSAAEIRRRLTAVVVGSKTTTRIEQAHGLAATAPTQPPVSHLTKGLSPRGGLLPWVIAGAAMCVAAALGAMYFLHPWPAFDLSQESFTPVASGGDGGVFSPDDKSIAYVKMVEGKGQLFVKNIDPNALPVQLTSIGGVGLPFWSAKGDILYFMKGGRLWSIGAGGGEPRPLFDSLYVAAAALPRDGAMLLLWAETQLDSGDSSSSTAHVMSLLVSSPPGAPPRRLAPTPFEPKGLLPVVSLRLSPDGFTAAFCALKSDGGTAFWLIPLSEREHSRPYELSWEYDFFYPPLFDWFPDSRTVVLSDRGNLWFADTKTGRLRRATATTSSHENPRVSHDGKRILFGSGSQDNDIVEVPLNGSPPRTLIGSGFREYNPSWSLSGERMAYLTERSGKGAIWIRNQKEDLRAAVTGDEFAEDRTTALGMPVISPDGKRVAYIRRGSTSELRLWVSPIEGGRPTVLIDERTCSLPSWSPDSKQIVAVAIREGQFCYVVKTVGSQDSARMLYSGSSVATPPVWSPKGNWIAFGVWKDSIMFISPDARQSRKIMSPVPVQENRYSLTWKRDGSSLYVLSSTGDESRLDEVDIGFGTSRKIAGYGSSITFSAYFPLGFLTSLSPDEKSLITSTGIMKSDLWILEGFPAPETMWR